MLDALARLAAELAHLAADKLEARRIERARLRVQLAKDAQIINGGPAAP